MRSKRLTVIARFAGASALLGTACLGGMAAFSATATTLSTVRINTGGAAVTDSDGMQWKADTGFTGGQLSSTTSTIASTAKQSVFRDMRFGMSAYRIPVVNGTYDVTLPEAEIYFKAAGKRVFSVTAEGNTVATNVDVFKLAGGMNRAYWIKFRTTVTDGALDLGFKASVNYA